MRTGVAVACFALIASVSGCGPSAPPAVPPPAAAASTALVAFDGTYRGTIRLTAAAPRGDQRSWCDTPPDLTLIVQNGAFAFTLEHPNVPPGQGFSSSPTFIANVETDGSFDSTSPNGVAQMTGRISGQQVTGQISGAACGYAFTAQKS